MCLQRKLTLNTTTDENLPLLKRVCSHYFRVIRKAGAHTHWYFSVLKHLQITLKIVNNFYWCLWMHLTIACVTFFSSQVLAVASKLYLYNN